MYSPIPEFSARAKTTVSFTFLWPVLAFGRLFSHSLFLGLWTSTPGSPAFVWKS